jgi:hypothetical protein
LFADVIPDAFAAPDFDLPILLAIPMLDDHPFPLCLRIINDRLQGRQPDANGSLRGRPICPGFFAAARLYNAASSLKLETIVT